ncbi:MAG: (d)CMP kinase [Deltaproteobacteria bacterium]|nr:MAG: (d)CMP kinase [Deltaproteobacteria bacterium]
MNKKLIIAIDGPSGAGKSTLSKALAKQLDYLNIDTGAMYRSVALLTQQQGIDSHDGVALKALCAEMSIEFVREDLSERVFVNGIDVSEAIRTPEVSLLTSQVSASPAVREAMVQLQQQMGEAGGVVLEGRDIGTVVFPYADVKFFLSATAAERGLRRYKEFIAKGIDVNLQQTIADVEARDTTDTARTLAPLMQADDAVVVDSTQLSIADVLSEMLTIVKVKEAELTG